MSTELKIAACVVEEVTEIPLVTKEDLAIETASIASSIVNYQYENGRRYTSFKAGNYVIPNDDQEQVRLDVLHHLHCLILGGDLYAAPVKQPQAVLDIGTGTGLWAIEMADMLPNARVIATDLSAIQPSWAPGNITFEIDDIELEWTFPCKFDYIHLRNMGGSIADWQGLLEKCLENLNPGGYVEVVDGEAWASTDDGSLPETSAFHEWQTNLNAAAREFGRDLNIIPRMKNLVEKAGFEAVEDKIVKVPLNHWDVQTKADREWARIMNVVMMETVDAYSLALFTKVLGWDRKRLDKLLNSVRSDLKNSQFHMYTNMHHVFGRKPEI